LCQPHLTIYCVKWQVRWPQNPTILHVATLLWKSVKMRLTLPKWGLRSPGGLPKLQSSILGVETPCLEVIFIPLESYRSVKVENGLTWTIWTSAAQVMDKRRAESQTNNLTHMSNWQSRESTQPQCVQGECNILLESSQGELQVYFRLHPNRRSEQRVMTSQSLESPNRDSFGTPLWESRDKKPFRRGCGEVTQRILCGGRWWLPPSPGCGESCESRVARGLS
jgi:hypothetical protein